MSKAYNSPTARLLQSSRLFSLPRPLPQAPLETPSSTGLHRASDSATQFYPTHQAISTPSSSHYRGDWGLKRAIPGKTTRSSTPSIRVLGQDTSDHITEFESAADHERSRAKWVEMGVPIMARGNRDRIGANRSTLSVYEDFLDNTDPDAAPVVLRSGADTTNGSRTTEARRWKYAGPFVAGMQEGEFQRYVERQLRARREEWTEYLMDHFAKQNFEIERREAQANEKWYGPFEAAGPWVQGDLVMKEAENKGEELLQKALLLKRADEEARARQEVERLLAAARQKAQEYAAEGRRWDAPEEARKILVQAQRTANAERANMERSGDSFGEGEARMQLIISDAITSVYRLLNIESSNTADIAEADKRIREAQKQITDIQIAKTNLLKEWQAKHIPTLKPSLEELSELEKGLRDGHANLGSDLAKLITTFLDIPAVNTEIPGSSNARTSGFGIELSNLGDNEMAPPVTHPAAGLSHIRTNAFMENHPIHGPQAYPSPILARVLMARGSARSTSSQAQLGVGGFVALDPNTSGFGKTSRRNDHADPTHQLDPDAPGGNKVYVRPTSATIDEAGRVKLSVSRADNEAVAVKEGNVEHIHQGRGSGAARSAAVGLPPSLGMGRPRQPANYGFSLSDHRRMAMDERRPTREYAPRSRVSGYDAEAAKLGGKVNEERTLEMMQELSKGVNQ